MSALHVYVIACDAQACRERFSRDLHRADETRMYAAQQGWKHGIAPAKHRSGPARSLDYCPEHAEFAVDLIVPVMPVHAREVVS